MPGVSASAAQSFFIPLVLPCKLMVHDSFSLRCFKIVVLLIGLHLLRRVFGLLQPSAVQLHSARVYHHPQHDDKARSKRQEFHSLHPVALS